MRWSSINHLLKLKLHSCFQIEIKFQIKNIKALIITLLVGSLFGLILFRFTHFPSKGNSKTQSEATNSAFWIWFFYIVLFVPCTISLQFMWMFMCRSDVLRCGSSFAGVCRKLQYRECSASWSSAQHRCPISTLCPSGLEWRGSDRSADRSLWLFILWVHTLSPQCVFSIHNSHISPSPHNEDTDLKINRIKAALILNKIKNCVKTRFFILM